MMISVIKMPKIYYHPCPQALGEYNYHKDTIILNEGLKYKKIHDSILRHEQDHAQIFKEHSGFLKRLALNLLLDYKTRITGTTSIPIDVLRELNPSTFKDNLYQTLYLLAYIPILIIEGFCCIIKDILSHLPTE